MSNPSSPTIVPSPLLNHLIIVCCHAIHLGGPTNGIDESEWAIEPFQCGETPTFITHIHAALEALRERPDSLCVFSGGWLRDRGATKRDRTPLTESESYLNLALTMHPLPPSPSTYLITDPYATDSFQNLLFPLLLFTALHPTQRPPHSVTLITHAFKRRRFLELHVPAIRFPGSKMRFVGIDPPEKVSPRRKLEEGERRNGWEAWSGDWYGEGNVLGAKRRGRGWRAGDVNWEVARGREWVVGLLEWEGGESGREVWRGWLPWDKDEEGEGGERARGVEDERDGRGGGIGRAA